MGIYCTRWASVLTRCVLPSVSKNNVSAETAFIMAEKMKSSRTFKHFVRDGASNHMMCLTQCGVDVSGRMFVTMAMMNARNEICVRTPESTWLCIARHPASMCVYTVESRRRHHHIWFY